MAGLVDWESFGVMTGGASGALTGLLFVAVSLNAQRIAGHPVLRAIAAQTLVLFIAPLVMATVLLVPRQPDWALGTEFIAAGLSGGLPESAGHRAAQARSGHCSQAAGRPLRSP